MRVTFKDSSVVEYLTARWLYHRDMVTAVLMTDCGREVVAEILEDDISEITLDGVSLPTK